MLQPKTRWRLAETDEEKATTLARELGIAPLIAKLLVLRGMDHPETAKRFLTPEPLHFHDPFLLHGMEKSIARVKKAIQTNEPILIYGDYDADGVSSTSLMIHMLRQCSANFNYYIPNRFTEGYGLNNKALQKAADEGFSLIITVDTGISAYEQVEYGKTLGLDIVITDHHEPPPIIPDAFAVINPKKKECTYPFDMLAGVGVAFKFAHALLGKLPMHLLEIAAIGTIADLVPLVDENRIIAKLGLEAMNRSAFPGIRALKEACGIKAPVASTHIGFSIAPRINAAGRLGSAGNAVELLTTEDDEEASELAEELDALNKERQALVAQIASEAKEMAEALPNHLKDVIIVAKEGWNEGVIGIVASKLVEQYYRPAIVFSIHPETGMAKGSARSIEGFDFYKALSACSQYMSHFGGHFMAAGMSLPSEKVPELHAALNGLIKEWLTDDDFIPLTKVDATCGLSDINIEMIEQLNGLSPFGAGNEYPLFRLEEVELTGLRTIGKENNHLKCICKQEQFTIDGIGFGLGELTSQIALSAAGDVIGELAINEWNGVRKPQFIVRDLSISKTQIFDFRGTKEKQKKILLHADEESVVLCFRKSSLQDIPLDNPSFQVLFVEDGDESKLSEIGQNTIRNLFIYDMPYNAMDLYKILASLEQVERVYCLFGEEYKNQLMSIPAREQFKLVYGYLFHLKSITKENLLRFAKSKGIMDAATEFILEVFYDLGFIRAEGNQWVLAPTPSRQVLTESRTYQRKKSELLAETDLLYSNYTILCGLLNEALVKKASSKQF
jgi:single-stranded-DNA-specific exonuclease